MKLRTSLPALAATLLVISACSEAPTAPVVPEAAPTPPTDAAPVAEANTGNEANTGDETPRFVPYDTPPRLRNAREVSRTLQELYPAELKEAGVGGMANVWLFIDETGIVQDAQLNRSSGVDEIDAAALELAGTMDFEPARNRDRAVAVWVAIPITFSAGG